MRTAPYIQTLWAAGGPFVGADGKPNTILTVQLPFLSDPWVREGDEDHVIHPTIGNVGVGNYGPRGIPLRWYQNENNSQVEREIPNVQTFTTDRSIESDAATCSITIYNQWMRDNDDPEALTSPSLGMHGYFTPSYGKDALAQSRWAQTPNEWEDILVPNAIIRSYQGYGGHAKTRAQAIVDGNIMLTGVWLVDEVRVGTDGFMKIDCRDMGKLLIEQQLYPPLVPRTHYPLKYYRWDYRDRAVQARAKTSTTTEGTTGTNIAPGNKRAVFRDSAVDRWYPQESPGSEIPNGGFLLHGHRAVDCLDGNQTTFCLSVGNSGPDKPFATDWWTFDCGEWMNAVYVHPWAGNYTMYVSVMEDGRWQGTETIPYDPSSLYGTQDYVVDTGADIKYVAKFGVPWETAKTYVLPRAYKADRVRISFRHQALSPWGPWYYRCGMREFRIKATTSASISSSTTETIVTQPAIWAADNIRNHDNLNQTGYMTVDFFGHYDAFGDMRKLSMTGGDGASEGFVRRIVLTEDATGYYVLRDNGGISCFGDAPFFGSPRQDGVPWPTDIPEGRQNHFMALCLTPSEQGYWAIQSDGTIYSYGDAATYTKVNPTGFAQGDYVVNAASRHGSQGMWIVDTRGVVHVRGAATHYGNFTEATLNEDGEAATDIESTMGDDGYWILSSGGRVQAFGAAVDHGQVIQLNTSSSRYERYHNLMVMPDDAGYMIVQGDGSIIQVGDTGGHYFGQPVPGSTRQLRIDGNYKDYVDIIRDLALWSGFLLFDSDLSGSSAPSVYGSLESTGAWSEDPLPDDLFDKRPVIDAMTEIKETVGYLLFVDDEGRLHFESPNWWGPGNFNENGIHDSFLPEVDERVNMTDYTASFNDENLRSLIIISSEDPDIEGTTTIATKLVPQTASGLKGLLVPAMWVNGFFQNQNEQRLMAELISMHIWFQQRIGQVTCVANPAIQINDQIRIYERNTSDSYVHYVRGISTTHSLESGEYTMTLTTNWLGGGEDWAITSDVSYTEDPNKFVMSTTMMEWLQTLASRSASQHYSVTIPPPPPPVIVPDPGDTTVPEVEEGGSGPAPTPTEPAPPPSSPPPAPPDTSLGSGTTYYVSNSGNDSNNGTSTSTPWATIAKVNSFNFSPGDNVLFQRGGHWETTTLRIDNSGTSTNRITFADYGSGDLPTIDGGGNYANGSPLNSAPGPWPIKGNWVPLEIDGSYVTVRNFRFQQSSWTGVDIRGDYVIVEGCTTRWNVVGIETDDSCQYATLRYNSIVDNAAMSVNTPTNVNPDDDSGAFGILLHGDFADIHHNTISGSRAWSYDYGFDGAAVEVFRGRQNVIHHNWCENNEAFSELGNTESYGNIYHHNMIINTTPGAIGLNIQGTGTFGPVQGTRFEHNTVYMPAASCQGIIVGTNANCVAYNNIIWATMKAGSTASAIDENNNLYYGHSQQQIKSIHDPGQDGIGPQSITGQNPLFVNAAGEDFHLQAGSPAINKGVNRYYTTDYDGNPRSVGGVPDIGAFERQ